MRRNHLFDIMCLIPYTTDLLLFVILYLLKIASRATNVSPKGSEIKLVGWVKDSEDAVPRDIFQNHLMQGVLKGIKDLLGRPLGQKEKPLLLTLRPKMNSL